MDNITNHAYRVAVDERIRQLIEWRRWYRARPDWGAFLDLKAEHDIELRALVRLARMARRASHPLIERDDPLTAAKADEEWTNREGMPEFNGAFR